MFVRGFLIKLTLADWSHAAGVDIVYTVELRDTGTYGFVLPGTWKNKTYKISIKNKSIFVIEKRISDKADLRRKHGRSSGGLCTRKT